MSKVELNVPFIVEKNYLPLEDSKTRHAYVVLEDEFMEDENTTDKKYRLANLTTGVLHGKTFDSLEEIPLFIRMMHWSVVEEEIEYGFEIEKQEDKEAER